MRKILILTTLFFTLFGFAQQRDIELTDIWASGTFYPKTISGFVNLNDGKTYCIKKSDQKGNSLVEKLDYSTGESKGLVIDGARLATAMKLEAFNFSTFELSADESKALLQFNAESIYRHSFRANAVVVNLSDYSYSMVDDDKVRYPTFDPTGTKVAFVKNNDLYIRDLVKSKTTRVTKDGEKNAIINGAVDWVYEEEFSMSRGYEWNVDGTYIAFYKFDESEVKEWVMPIYGDLYPYQERYKYPKAGEANSVVNVVVCKVKNNRGKTLELGSENDQYLPRIKWTKNLTVLSIQRMNRLQNKWEMLLADMDEKEVKLSLEETDERYLDVNDDIYFLSDKEHMIVMSEASGYRQLYFHKVAGPQVFPITKGSWDVDQVLAIDEKNELIYFTSAEVSPVERHIYSIKFDGSGKRKLTSEPGWHTADFSADKSLILHKHGTPEQGYIYTMRNADWTVVRMVEDNKEFRDNLKGFKLGDITFNSLETERGDKLNYWMIRPKDFNPNKEYPLLMFVYGGPGSQTVKMDFMYSNYFWHQMLANKHNYIVVSVDNRGTGARGSSFKKMTYKQLGKYETEDQISAAKYFAAQPYIDKNRVGIWGWSYGGYMSSLCLAKGNDVFSTAIAVAPVSNWRYYDNIYTERYMQRPQDNAEGYDNNSPINFVKDIKGKYLIVHGTGDDNVHFQNSVMMVDELIKHNIPFDSEYYPNRNHGIYGGSTRLHLYNKMTSFILENL
ncbi:prolyl oligopeptidase family serine peptidase [bacterium]|nr:prolyl oligopeptidase family serine peptidase [bacterium]